MAGTIVAQNLCPFLLSQYSLSLFSPPSIPQQGSINIADMSMPCLFLAARIPHPSHNSSHRILLVKQPSSLVTLPFHCLLTAPGVPVFSLRLEFNDSFFTAHHGQNTGERQGQYRGMSGQDPTCVQTDQKSRRSEHPLRSGLSMSRERCMRTRKGKDGQCALGRRSPQTSTTDCQGRQRPQLQRR